ncbi:hypothetical protein MJD09_12980 [bacterium]|nr:hypothetical protein [bacterium]
MQVYLKLYHLGLVESQKGGYTIDFHGARLEQSESEEMITTSFEFDTFASTVAETFGIDISKLGSGDYELSVTITDKVSSLTKTQQRRFALLEGVR